MKEGKSQGGIVRREILLKVKVRRNRAALSRRVNENVRTTLEQGAPRGGDGYVSAPGGGGTAIYGLYRYVLL